MNCIGCGIKVEGKCEECEKNINKCENCLLTDLKRYYQHILDLEFDNKDDKIKLVDSQIKEIKKIKNKCWYCID